jgi:hypothetical protein
MRARKRERREGQKTERYRKQTKTTPEERRKETLFVTSLFVTSLFVTSLFVTSLFVTSSSVAGFEPAHGTQHSNCCEPTETLCFSARPSKTSLRTAAQISPGEGNLRFQHGLG